MGRNFADLTKAAAEARRRKAEIKRKRLEAFRSSASSKMRSCLSSEKDVAIAESSSGGELVVPKSGGTARPSGLKVNIKVTTNRNTIMDLFGGTTIQVEDERASQMLGSASSLPAFYYISPAPPPSGSQQKPSTSNSGNANITALPAPSSSQLPKTRKLPPRAAKEKAQMRREVLQLHRMIMNFQRENGRLKKHVEWLETQLANCMCGGGDDAGGGNNASEQGPQRGEEPEHPSLFVQPKAEIVNFSTRITPSSAKTLSSRCGDVEDDAENDGGVCGDQKKELAQRSPPVQVKAEIVEPEVALSEMDAPAVCVSSPPPTSSSKIGRQRKSKVEMLDLVEESSSTPAAGVTPSKFFSQQARVESDELSPTRNQRTCRNEAALRCREQSPVKVVDFNSAVVVKRRRMDEQRKWTANNRDIMPGVFSGISVTSSRSVVPPVISLPLVRHHLPSIMRLRNVVQQRRGNSAAILGKLQGKRPENAVTSDGRQAVKTVANDGPPEGAAIAKRRRKDVPLQRATNNNDADAGDVEMVFFSTFRRKIGEQLCQPTGRSVNLDTLFMNQ